MEDFINSLDKIDQNEIENKITHFTNDSNKDKVKYEMLKRLKTLNEPEKYKDITALLNLTDLLLDKEDLNNFLQDIYSEVSSMEKNYTNLIIDSFINNYSIENILYASRGFVGESFILSDEQLKIDKILIEKVKSEYKETSFHTILSNELSRAILNIWRGVDSKELENYLITHLNIANLTDFIKAFLVKWSESDNSNLGNFRESNYKLLCTIIEPKIINDIIINKYPEYESIEIKKPGVIWSKYEKTNDDDYLKQFLFWFKKQDPSLG